MVSLTSLAKNEALTAKNRSAAEDAWRDAWWKVTDALETSTLDDRREVARILGQSNDYVSDRWRLARWKAGRDLSAYPPRMALVITDIGEKDRPDVERGIALLQKAVTDEMSLREFRHAITGKQWADTPAAVLTSKAVTEDPTVLLDSLTQVPDTTLTTLVDALVNEQTKRAVAEAGGNATQTPPARTGGIGILPILERAKAAIRDLEKHARNNETDTEKVIRALEDVRATADTAASSLTRNLLGI